MLLQVRRTRRGRRPGGRAAFFGRLIGVEKVLRHLAGLDNLLGLYSLVVSIEEEDRQLYMPS